MPPFSNALSRRWSPSDLPILPFLAPRVFQPWPSKSARGFSKTETESNQGHDGHAQSRLGREEEVYSNCLEASSPNVLVPHSKSYAKFSKGRTTPTSFACLDIPDHGSMRNFSSKASFRSIATNNGDSSPVEGYPKTPHESGSNGPLKSQPNPATSTRQDSSKPEDSTDTSFSLRPRRVRSTPSSYYRPNINLGAQRVPFRPTARYLRALLGGQDASTSHNTKTSRPMNPTPSQLYSASEPTHQQQPSSSVPVFTARTETVSNQESSPSSPLLKPPPENLNNATNSSHPSVVPEATKFKRTRNGYSRITARRQDRPVIGSRIRNKFSCSRNTARRQERPVIGSRIRNKFPRGSLFFRRPNGYKFPREKFRRPKGILSVNRIISLNRQRLYSQRFATDQTHELRAHYELWAKQQGLPQLPTKYLKVRMHAAPNSMEMQLSKWSSRFAIINQRHEDALKGYPKLEYNKVIMSKFPTASRLLFIKQDNVAALATLWRRVPTEIRSHVWEELMLTAMDQHPASTLKLLLATYQAPCFPPGWAANDCLDFVVSHYFGSEEHKPNRESFTAQDLRRIFDSVQYLQLRGLRLSARSMYLLQLIMDDQEFRKFYLILTGTRHHLTGKTLLRFTYRFARSRQTDLAFRVLRQATQQGIDLNLGRWPQICNVLLTGRYRDYNAHVTGTELFDFMLRHGLKPGIVTYNILIQNSLQAGDHVTAWQIYDMMIENRVMADVYTYSIMLNDAKIRGDDVAVEKLAYWMTEDGVRNSYTITDILDTIFRLHKREFFKRTPSDRKSLQVPFSQMPPIYLKNFNARPLAQLIPRFQEKFLEPGPINPVDRADDTHHDIQVLAQKNQHHPDLSITDDIEAAVPYRESDIEATLLEPNHVTLIVMLKSYIWSVGNYQTLLTFYNHFKALIAAKDPIVAPLLKAQIYNHLLVGLGHLDAPMHECLKVVADMQTLHSKSRRSVKAGETDRAPLSGSSKQNKFDLESDDATLDTTDDTFWPPPPSLHTWTTLLNLFTQRHQPRAAEKVLQIMIEKEGLEPNQATWNALTMGYMRLQDPQMTADALIRTKRAGFVVDNIMSSRWWLRFQARARLSESLQSASGGNETSLADVANAMESESEVPDPAEDEIIDEEVLEATTSRTGDIYRILKRRLHAVNSPVYPNWIFDAMIRVGEENIVELEAEPISDEIAESEAVSAQSPDELSSVDKQNPRPRSNSQDTGSFSLVDDHDEQQQPQPPPPSEIEDKRDLRLLPANKLIVRRLTQWKMTPKEKAFHRDFQKKASLGGGNPFNPHDRNFLDRQS